MANINEELNDKTSISVMLSPQEAIIVQEALKEYGEQGMYQWMKEIYDGAVLKINAAYQKPIMTKEEYDNALNLQKAFWMENSDPDLREGVTGYMVHAEQKKLEFFNRIPGVNDATGDIESAIEDAMLSEEVIEPDYEMEM